MVHNEEGEKRQKESIEKIDLGSRELEKSTKKLSDVDTEIEEQFANRLSQMPSNHIFSFRNWKQTSVHGEVEAIMKEKEKYDRQCEELRLRFESMRDFSIIFFNSKHKSKQEVEEAVERLERGVIEESKSNVNVLLFDKIYNDVIDENYQYVHFRFRQNLQEIFKEIVQKNRNYSAEELERECRKYFEGEHLVEQELTNQMIRCVVEEKEESLKTEVKEKGPITYESLEYILLKHFLNIHIQFLLKSRQNFNYFD